MKRVVFLLLAIFMISGCSTTKETAGTAESKMSRKQAVKSEIKKAIESRKYAIRVNRIYTSEGIHQEMKPENNFIIVNGDIASISLGYIGRSYGIRPISGINLNGRTLSYKMESREDKGKFEIEMEVKYNGDKFDVYMSIGDEGYCSISLINPYIQTVTYAGTLAPLKTPSVANKKGGPGL